MTLYDEPDDTLRPQQRDPDAEPPHVEERDVTLALAGLAGETWGTDGATCLNEFFFNDLSVEQQNALLLSMYVNNETLRALFAKEYGEGLRNKLRGIA
jgi:hypothetical protein